MGDGYKRPGRFATWINDALRQASIDRGEGKRWPEHARWVRFRIRVWNCWEGMKHPVETIQFRYNRRKFQRWLERTSPEERANIRAAFKELEDQ